MCAVVSHGDSGIRPEFRFLRNRYGTLSKSTTFLNASLPSTQRCWLQPIQWLGCQWPNLWPTIRCPAHLNHTYNDSPQTTTTYRKNQTQFSMPHLRSLLYLNKSFWFFPILWRMFLYFCFAVFLQHLPTIYLFDNYSTYWVPTTFSTRANRHGISTINPRSSLFSRSLSSNKEVKTWALSSFNIKFKAVSHVREAEILKTQYFCFPEWTEVCNHYANFSIN